MKNNFFKYFVFFLFSIFYLGFGINEANAETWISSYEGRIPVGGWTYNTETGVLSGNCSLGTGAIRFHTVNGSIFSTWVDIIAVNGQSGHVSVNLNSYPHIKNVLERDRGIAVTFAKYTGVQRPGAPIFEQYTEFAGGGDMIFLRPQHPPVQRGTIRIKYIDQDTNQEIVPSDVLSGPIGQNAERDILAKANARGNEVLSKGYSFVSFSNVKLSYQGNEQVVIVRYKKRVTTGTIRIKYIDQDTNQEIVPSDVLSGPIGQNMNYVIQEKFNSKTRGRDGILSKGYSLVFFSNINLAFQENEQVVIFKFKKNIGTIRIKYIDQDTNQEIVPGDVLSGPIGQNAERDILAKANARGNEVFSKGYSFVSFSNVKLSYQGNEQVVIVRYKKRVTTGTIRMKYIDQDTNQEIVSSDVLSGPIGQNAERDILAKANARRNEVLSKGYSFVSFSNVKLSYQGNEQVVIVRYKKRVCTIIVRYKDVDTNKEIYTPQLLTGKFNEQYDVTSKRYQPTIPGYKLDYSRLPNNRKGTFTKEKEEVIYYYSVVKNSQQQEFNFLGLGDCNFAQLAVVNGIANIDSKYIHGGAHCYFKNKVYASIQIKNTQGKEVFKKEYIGDKTMPASIERVELKEGYTLTIHHEEPTRLRTNNDANLHKEDAKDFHYIFTNKALVLQF